MANPHKGEVTISIDGMPYVACFPSNSIVEVENLLGGISIGEIAADMDRVAYQRALLWAGLQRHHPEVTLVMAGDLLDECDDGLQGVAEKLAKALRFRISRVAIDAPLTGADD